MSQDKQGEITNGIRRVLSIPFIYSTLQNILGSSASSRRYVDEYIRPSKGCRILDIGCGPADIVEYMPSDVVYTGVDHNEAYIEAARKRYTNQCQFLVTDVNDMGEQQHGQFDIIVATGLLHHLNDLEVTNLLKEVKPLLAIGGRFVTLDGGITVNQNWIARFLLKKDRGQFVRTPDAYQALHAQVFAEVHVDVLTDMLRVPYTHVIVTSTNDDVQG